MEALLLIFAEIIFACLAPLFAAIGAFAAVLLELLVLMLTSLFGGVSQRRKPGRAPRKPFASRKVLHWFAGGIAAVGIAGLVASVVLFQPILRHALTGAADKAGIALRYDGASGSLLAGRVKLEGIEMTRASETGLAFDLTVQTAIADVDLWSLLGREPRIEFAKVAGVRGTITPPERDEAGLRTRKERRPFRAEQAEVSDILLDIQPRQGEAYALEISTGSVAPFRSSLALFDLLFRSNLEARIADQPLRVATREITDQGRETIWDFDRVEADRLKLIVPKAPLTWLSGGKVSARVEDRWSLSDDWIDMDWRIALQDIEVTAQDDAGSAERLLSAGLKKLVDAKGGDATFGYRLELSPEQVAALRSGDLRQFWEVVLSGTLDRGRWAKSDATEPEKPAGESRTDRALNGLKGLFDRKDDESQ